MGTGFLWGMTKKMFRNQLIVAQLCEYTKIHQIVYFKTVNIMIHELHLNFFLKKDSKTQV